LAHQVRHPTVGLVIANAPTTSIGLLASRWIRIISPPIEAANRARHLFAVSAPSSPHRQLSGVSIDRRFEREVAVRPPRRLAADRRQIAAPGLEPARFLPTVALRLLVRRTCGKSLQLSAPLASPWLPLARRTAAPLHARARGSSLRARLRDRASAGVSPSALGTKRRGRRPSAVSRSPVGAVPRRAAF